MSRDSLYQQLRTQLAYLRLTAAAEALPGELDTATKTKATHAEFWFASDFGAEGPPRNDPRLGVSSIELRGASHGRAGWAPCAEEAVGGDEVGDLLAGD